MIPPIRVPRIHHKGKVSDEVTLEKGDAAETAIMLIMSASLMQFTGDLDEVKQFRLHQKLNIFRSFTTNFF